jgi:hypothetical protein
MRTAPLFAPNGILLAAALLAGVGCSHVGPAPAEVDGGDTDTGDTDTGDTDTAFPYDLDAGLHCDGGVDMTQPSPDGAGEIPTGIEWCPDGSRHRYAAVPCTNDSFDAPPCTDEGFDCSSCADGQACIAVDDDFPCACITPCASDADCADGESCWCESTGITRCIPSECRTDADCGSTECGVSTNDCNVENRLACRTADDECHGNLDCAEDGYAYCVFLGDAWGCVEGVDPG